MIAKVHRVRIASLPPLEVDRHISARRNGATLTQIGHCLRNPKAEEWTVSTTRKSCPMTDHAEKRGIHDGRRRTCVGRAHLVEITKVAQFKFSRRLFGFGRNLCSRIGLKHLKKRPRRERPRRRAAEQRDERASPHSITSSARASSVGGISRPSALAVIRLMTKSNLVGCSTGRSAGFAPRRILSTYSAARRNESTKFGP
jgi:hypothetical protein